ncbi:hypothetical protein [Rhodopirellula sp. MGV]|uniref:hypothetical protein n=1 Tax=Rhodopirellula sp. MGV TaxID=2023130 RepID=UPI000B979489|nr:hypothetical protein [Rhodopirellula sp. MGV]OYP34189.1 hypothetical protein CGZ80_16180 [Rhodopirellula sp. MGV]PNY33623.1 hypothetical protein C2E31_27905 [Rhodopirellula baltica]
MMQQYNAVLAYFGTWLQGEAERREMRSIDMFSPLNQLTQDARIETPEFTFIGDAVHPGPAGQLIMAYAWLEDLGQQGPVSTITLTPTAKGYRNRANGGTVSNVSSQDETIEFDFLANSLPWVTPQSTEKAAEMLRLGHRFSKESLQVHGLQPGKYALTIDGTHIGEFSNNQLAAHIELQRFANTPQSQQAANVVAMNAKRNETTIRQLRDHWVAYRNLQRDKRSLENAGDENAKKRFEQRVSEGEQRTEGFEAKLVELEKQADAELAEIYKAAQPQTHHYVLTKVE